MLWSTLPGLSPSVWSHLSLRLFRMCGSTFGHVHMTETGWGITSRIVYATELGTSGATMDGRTCHDFYGFLGRALEEWAQRREGYDSLAQGSRRL